MFRNMKKKKKTQDIVVITVEKCVTMEGTSNISQVYY